MAIKRRAFAWVLLLTCIIWLAFLIRVWNLTKESFWADEGWTMMLSKGPTLSDVLRTMADDQHPPLYFVLMHYWVGLAGNSEFTTRFLSLAWSVIGVALVYRIGADVFSPGAGAAAALMLALADNDTFLAQDARHYTEMATLASASTLFYLRYLRHPSRANGIGWLLSSATLMYTHYLGGFILIVQLVHLLIFAGSKRRDMLLRWGAICAAWLPWAFVFLNQSLVRYTRPVLFQSTWPNTPEALSIVRNDLIGTHFGLTGGLLLLGLVYVGYRQGIPFVRWRPAWPTVYLLLWLAIPVMVIIGINSRFPILTTRNFLLVTPVIALLIGHGIMNLDRLARVLVLVILVIVSLITVDAYFVKPPWRQVAQDILQYRVGNEPILMNARTDEFALRYHIGRDLHADPDTLPVISLLEYSLQYRNNFYPALLQYLSDKDSFWIAHWGDPDDELLHWFNQQGFTRSATQVETHLETNKIYIYHYDRVKPDATVLARFGDQFGLLSASADQPDAHTVKVHLLWKVLQKPPVDYSVSVFLMNAGGVPVATHDGPPLDGRSPTTSWQAGEVRFDSQTITLPTDLPVGTYTVGLKIYWYVDQKPLAVTAGNSKPSAYYTIQQINIGQGNGS